MKNNDKKITMEVSAKKNLIGNNLMRKCVTNRFINWCVWKMEFDAKESFRSIVIQWYFINHLLEMLFTGKWVSHSVEAEKEKQTLGYRECNFMSVAYFSLGQ